jgi:hypothetical protein
VGARRYADRQDFNLEAFQIEHLSRAADDLEIVDGSRVIAVEYDVQVFANDLADDSFGAVSQVDNDTVGARMAVDPHRPTSPPASFCG